LEPEQEVRITGEAIDLRDHRRCLPHPTLRQRSRELRTVIEFAAFDLYEFRQRRRTETGEVG
jgi:hypothetical protein